MFNNILVAYDGSSSSRAAAQQAYELAKANNAQVTILSVAPSVAALAASVASASRNSVPS